MADKDTFEGLPSSPSPATSAFTAHDAFLNVYELENIKNIRVPVYDHTSDSLRIWFKQFER
jgi:hypothetical protein